jgi:hypothetical protein
MDKGMYDFGPWKWSKVSLNFELIFILLLSNDIQLCNALVELFFGTKYA